MQFPLRRGQIAYNDGNKIFQQGRALDHSHKRHVLPDLLYPEEVQANEGNHGPQKEVSPLLDLTATDLFDLQPAAGTEEQQRVLLSVVARYLEAQRPKKGFHC